MVYHVLIAEDEAVTRETVSAGLSRLLPGAKIHAVQNGVEAVACAKEWEICFAFLDIRMPEMNGITAAQKIRRLRKDCQIVFLTAYNDFEYVRSALKLDAVDYLLKPFDQGTLADAVQKVMKRMGEHWEESGITETDARWLEEREVEELLCGRLNPAWIPAGICGTVAAMTGPSAMQMQRLKHVLMGMDMGSDIRLLAGKKEAYLFIAAWSMAEDTLLEQIKKQMDMLAARLERQFGIRLWRGISGIFYDDGDIPEACLDAFCQLQSCTDQEPSRISDHVMQGDLLDALSGKEDLSAGVLPLFYHLMGKDSKSLTEE